MQKQRQRANGTSGPQWIRLDEQMSMQTTTTTTTSERVARRILLSACDLIRYCCPIAVTHSLSLSSLVLSSSHSVCISVFASSERNVLPLVRHYNMPFAIEFSSTSSYRTYSSCLQPICIFVCSVMSECIKVSSKARVATKAAQAKF